MMKVDVRKNMAKIKYLEIFNIIKKRIENKEYTHKLPSEAALCEEFQVTRNTVRRSIRELAKRGLVQSVFGKGVFILKQDTMDILLGDIESFKQLKTRTKRNMETIVLEFSEVLTKDITQKKLPFEQEDHLYHVKRLRLDASVPIVLDESYFLKSVLKDLTPKIAQDSVYEYLKKRLSIEVAVSKKVIFVELIDEAMKELLQSRIFDSVIVIKNITYTNDGKLFEYTESRHRPDKFLFTEVINKE